MKISIFEAKSGFCRLIEKVQKGESFTITKRGSPVASLTPLKEKKASRIEVITMLADYRKFHTADFFFSGENNTGMDK